MALVEISKCAMSDCVYNQGGECVTREIEVDGQQKCVTYKPKAQATPPSEPTPTPQPRPTPPAVPSQGARPAPQGASVEELMGMLG